MGCDVFYDGRQSNVELQEACIRFIERCAQASHVYWRPIWVPPSKAIYRWLHSETRGGRDQIEVRESSTYPFFGGQLWPWEEKFMVCEEQEGPDFVARAHFVFDRSCGGQLVTVITRETVLQKGHFAKRLDQELRLALGWRSSEKLCKAIFEPGEPADYERYPLEEARFRMEGRPVPKIPNVGPSELDALASFGGYWRECGDSYTTFITFLLALRERFVPDLGMGDDYQMYEHLQKELGLNGTLDFFRTAEEDEVVGFFAGRGVME
jgi:hypothetical protein